MTEGSTGPDPLQMLSLIKASEGKGGSGHAPILMGLQLEVNVGANTSNPGVLKADGMLNKLPQGRPGIFAKLMKEMGFEGAQIVADIGKCAQSAGVIYQGAVTNGAPVTSNAPVGPGSDHGLA